MIEIFKIKVIRKDSETQHKKKVYESKSKLMKYGAELFKRHHNIKLWNSLEIYCKVYQMNDKSEWIEIDIPTEFMEKKYEKV